MTTSSHKKGKKPPRYHRRQVLVSGYSGAGKTTLITKLIARFAADGLAVGYAKHDGHSFSIDHEGKDTDRAYRAGAQLVTINDSAHRAAILRLGEPDSHLTEASAGIVQACEAHLDFVLVEGHKQAEGDKILVVSDKMAMDQLGAMAKGAFLAVGADTQPSEPLSMALKEAGLAYRCRDDVEAIAEAILGRFPRPAPVGIVLAGGKSSRMGKDKGLLNYHGKPQAQHVAELLSRHCGQVAISANGSQYDHLPYPVIADTVQGFGPLGGLASVMAAFPGQPILVVACDLPYIDDEALAELLSCRQPFKAATCYGSRSNGLPEPMFAIYEPTLQPRIWAQLGAVAAGEGKGCPRKLLLRSRIALLPPSPAVDLTNANHPAEYESIRAAVSGAQAATEMT